SYTINVQPVVNTTAALTLGSTVNGNLPSPGRVDSYTFTLAAAARLYFDALTSNTANPSIGSFSWSLQGPPGTVVSQRAFTSSDSADGPGNEVLALPAGSYTLTVDASSDITGAYSFRLLDLAAATALTPGTPASATLSPANSTTLYQFAASAG